MMDYVYLAAGFTGAMTLVFLKDSLFGRSGEGTAEVQFAPREQPLEVLQKAIAAARKEVLIQATMFAAPELAQALVEAKMRGVIVELLLDLSQERDPSSVLPFLLDQGLVPLIDHENRAASTQVVVIDERIVFTGGHALASYQEGENAEYMLILRDQVAVAKSFRQQFFLHRESARAPQLRGRPSVATPTPTPAPSPTSGPPATPPISETLARLLPGLRGVNLPSEDELAEQEKAA